VLTNGRVWTGNKTQHWAAAVAIGGNKIIAVGTREQVRRLAGPASTWSLRIVGVI
jgi:predicted amidohydrolase YtcJ